MTLSPDDIIGLMITVAVIAVLIAGLEWADRRARGDGQWGKD